MRSWVWSNALTNVRDASRTAFHRDPIDPERVEALPGVKRCVACQNRDEAGVTMEEPEYCPQCGSLVEIRASRGPGITRYRRFCTGQPPCRL